jgi:DNA-binding NtrC family response regulator
VNGLRVTDARLQGGEAIRVGRTILTVHRESPAFAEIERASSFGRVVGSSAAMRRAYFTMRKLAGADVPVLIEGESGTGKALVAKEIHRASGRAAGPFVPFDASSRARETLEETLLGSATEPGLLHYAAGGTLFIEEITELPRSAQIALCDALAAGANVRLMASTHRVLVHDDDDRSFTDELFFLLAPGRIELPPLRARDGDIERLARHFWQELATGHASRILPPDLLLRFTEYRWPGNVRELRSAVLARMTHGELGAKYRVDEVTPPGGVDFIMDVLGENLPFPLAKERVLTSFARRYIDRSLARSHGSVARAASASGVSSRYFQLVRARFQR